MDFVQTELCEYLQVRHSKLDATTAAPDSPTSSTPSSPSRSGSSQSHTQASLPSKFYKHWTMLWVVLNAEITPDLSYIGYCKKESDWLIDSQTIAKCFLGESFQVERPPPGYSKKYGNVLQLIFKGYRLDLGFDSMTKLDQWFKALQVVSERHHVDLVRCPERPELERDYVVQVCPTSYLIWSPNTQGLQKPLWEWHLKHIRRVHWHKNVNKLEVEPGRSSGTGEGHFYFTGQHSYRLFRAMKHMMASHSKISPTLSPQFTYVKRGSEGGGAEASSGGESDCTGTGDDWTGASSDSTFINFIRSQHQNAEKFLSPGVSPSPPPQLPRTGPPRSDELLYMQINQLTLNQDNQYSSIQALQNQALQNGSKTSPSPSPIIKNTLKPVVEVSDSVADDDDGYCKMVPNSIRTELRQRAEHFSPQLPYSSVPPPPNVHQHPMSYPSPSHLLHQQAPPSHLLHQASPSHLLHQIPPPLYPHRVLPNTTAQ